jgi:hypothetical protein
MNNKQRKIFKALKLTPFESLLAEKLMRAGLSSVSVKSAKSTVDGVDGSGPGGQAARGEQPPLKPLVAGGKP